MAAHHQTFGQQAAQRELEQLAAVSGDLILVEDRGCQEEDWLADLVITCRDIPEVEGGLQLERVERFTISVPPDFPFSYPQVEVQHDRFARQPHVQWGRYICLYASDNARRPMVRCPRHCGPLPTVAGVMVQAASVRSSCPAPAALAKPNK